MKKAVYGIAADEAIKNANLNITDKLLPTAIDPQAVAHAVSGEVDAAFINLNQALSIKDKVGEIFSVDERFYSEILITALKMKSCDKSTTYLGF